MAHISEQSIERVRQAADIVEVVSSYVDLKQKGRNFFGLCPFHTEKTPSFSVNPEKQIFKCFGCGAGGGSINFIMEKENIEFVDAIKHLAHNFNIKLEITGGDTKKYSNLKSQLIGIHELVCSHYHAQLFNSKEGEKALSYLQERGLSETIIKDFKVGFSLNSYDNVLKLLQKESFSAQAMKLSGLFAERDKGYYDRFRSRIMFPIKNYTGNVIAFGGRIFNNDNPAKYVNSPETPIYVKSNILYGLDANSAAIKEEKKAILVEGYMDLLQLVQNGIKNCVAISGTSFTYSHAKLIKRFSNDVYIIFDGDEAGERAALRCGYILAANAIESKIITPPEGLDPDDWVRKNGSEEILATFENAKDVVSGHYTFFSKKHPEGSLSINEFIQECLEELINIDDLIIREIMIKRLSELTSIDQVNISAVLNEKLSKRKKYKSVNEKIITDKEDKNLSTNYSSQLYDDIIRLCCCNKLEIREFIFDNFNPEWFKADIYKKIYEKIYIHLKSKNNPAIHIISEQINDKNVRQKFIDLTFNLDKF